MNQRTVIELGKLNYLARVLMRTRGRHIQACENMNKIQVLEIEVAQTTMRGAYLLSMYSAVTYGFPPSALKAMTSMCLACRVICG